MKSRTTQLISIQTQIQSVYHQQQLINALYSTISNYRLMANKKLLRSNHPQPIKLHLISILIHSSTPNINQTKHSTNYHITNQSQHSNHHHIQSHIQSKKHQNNHTHLLRNSSNTCWAPIEHPKKSRNRAQEWLQTLRQLGELTIMQSEPKKIRTHILRRWRLHRSR